MRKKILFVSAIILISLSVLLGMRWNAWFSQPNENPYTIPTQPDHITLTFGENVLQEQNINWRADTTLTPSALHVWEIGSKDTLHIKAQGKIVHDRVAKAAYYKATLPILDPQKSYQYNVTSNGKHSQNYTLRSPKLSAHQDTSIFVYIGDVQDPGNGKSKEIFNQIYHHIPHAAFWAFGGDMIERPMDKYWDIWFQSMDSLCQIIPIVAATGNHDYIKGIKNKLDNRWCNTFPNPQNGPVGFKGRTYQLNFPQYALWVLDTHGISTPWALFKHYRWLKQSLKTATQPWKIVMMHHPIYSSRKGRDNTLFRLCFLPLFERYGVSLVLQGHDHGYARVTTKIEGKKYSPVYLISSCSPKFYPQNGNSLQDVIGEGLNLYQIITTTPTTLNLRTYTDSGKIYDQFTLHKLPKQKMTTER